MSVKTVWKKMFFFYAGFWAEIEPVSKKKEDEDLLEDCDFYLMF